MIRPNEGEYDDRKSLDYGAIEGEAARARLHALRGPQTPPPGPYATRKPKDYSIIRPGDLVQVDTLDVQPLPGVILKHFTARDMVSRWDVLQVRRRATARTAPAFLDALQQRMPFVVRAIQVDGVSEFKAEFEQACHDRRIRLFVLPPRSPRLNGHVERAQRTYAHEFYELTSAETTVAAINEAVMDWENIYNHLRPQPVPRLPDPSRVRRLHRPTPIDRREATVSYVADY